MVGQGEQRQESGWGREEGREEGRALLHSGGRRAAAGGMGAVREATPDPHGPEVNEG